jgi:hypothetical protein
MSVTHSNFTPDNLIAGDFPIVIDSAILEKGEVLLRGSLLGKKSKTGNTLVLSDMDGRNRYEQLYGILAEDCDASEEDSGCVVYLCGEFNQRAVIFGEGLTPDKTKEQLRAMSIYLRDSVKA